MAVYTDPQSRADGPRQYSEKMLTFLMDVQTDERTYGWTDGRTDSERDRQTDRRTGQMDGRTQRTDGWPD